MVVNLPIWVVVVFGLGAGLVVFLVHRHHRQRRRQLEERTEQRIDEMRHEQTKQVERLRRERDRAKRTGHVEFVEDLLPALDGLRRASEEAGGSSTSASGLREGVDMTLGKVVDVLDRYDVETVEPSPGDPFEPECQEAVRAVDDTDVEPGTVVECHRPGYRYRERTIRPAMVEVAVGQEDSAEEADPSAEHRGDVDRESDGEETEPAATSVADAASSGDTN